MLSRDSERAKRANIPACNLPGPLPDVADRYDSSFSLSARSLSRTASESSRVAPLENRYALTLGSVPEGRKMTLLSSSRRNSMTLAAGSYCAASFCRPETRGITAQAA